MQSLQPRPAPRALGDELPGSTPPKCTAHAQGAPPLPAAAPERTQSGNTRVAGSGCGGRAACSGGLRLTLPCRRASASLRGVQLRTPEAAVLLPRTAARPSPWQSANCLRSQDPEVPRLRPPVPQFLNRAAFLTEANLPLLAAPLHIASPEIRPRPSFSALLELRTSQTWDVAQRMNVLADNLTARVGYEMIHVYYERREPTPASRPLTSACTLLLPSNICNTKYKSQAGCKL